MFVWENSDKGHSVSSSIIALESLISLDENLFPMTEKSN